jgi:hypothetical protein
MMESVPLREYNVSLSARPPLDIYVEPRYCDDKKTHLGFLAYGRMRDPWRAGTVLGGEGVEGVTRVDIESAALVVMVDDFMTTIVPSMQL